MRLFRLPALHPLTHVIEIRRADFNHGGTRDMAFRAHPMADVVLFFSQDVVIGGQMLIETLVHATLQDGVACAYGRKIAHADAPSL
jgi:rhamnosyltransferase